MPGHLRHTPRGPSEEEAREAERLLAAETVPARLAGNEAADAAGVRDVRLHRDEPADRLTMALDAEAVTVGDHVYLSDRAPASETRAGRSLLVHELTHVVQQRAHGERVQRFEASERSLIATDFAEMMTVIEAIVNASGGTDTVDMDGMVLRSGGHTAWTQMPGPLKSKDPKGVYMLVPRYLMTRRCGLVDMRHFMQLLYISSVTAVVNEQMANRAATRRGIEHEEHAEKASKYGPEDLTSNALGAWTATRLAAIPQKADLIARIRETLQRCEPVAFDALSPASQIALVTFYGAQSSGEPLNQNRTAVALIPAVPELAGTDRSFPFELNEDDPKRATISGRAFDRGVVGLTSDTEIRSFVSVQRDEVIAGIPAVERGRLGARLLSGWVSDDDLDAFTKLFRLGDAAGKRAMRAVAKDVLLSGIGQRTRLRLLLEETP